MNASPKNSTSPAISDGDVRELGYTASDLAFCSTPEARALISFELALRCKVLPISILRNLTGSTLYCAALGLTHVQKQELRFAVGCPISTTTVPADVLEEATVRAYLGTETKISNRLKQISLTAQCDTKKLFEVTPAKGDAALLLQTVIEFAYARGASDIHLCPMQEGARLKLRIDGELLVQEQHHYPRWIHEQMIGRLKVLGKLDISKKNIPQDGAFQFTIGSSLRSARISTLPTIHGESAVLRILYSHRIQTLDELALAPKTHAVLLDALKRKHGAILLTGPTGSGKTTTLYGALAHIERSGRNVVTVEDPVEIPIPGVVQVQVSTEQSLDYPAALRSALRHDPDALLIGEIRDPISAKIALDAAATGHLTLSSVHSGSAVRVIERLLSLGISISQTVDAISLVINQRLIPRLCPQCKIDDLESSRRFGVPLRKPVGCGTCDYSGFDGRVVVSESLPLVDRVAKDKLLRAYSNRASLEEVAGLLIPWTDSLKRHLVTGAISASQFEEFVDSEMEVL